MLSGNKEIRNSHLTSDTHLKSHILMILSQYSIDFSVIKYGED